MSWNTATMAATAILNSKRIEMYRVTTMKKMIRAWMAFLVTLPPQVGPTSLKLTLSGVVVGRLGQGVLHLVLDGLLLARRLRVEVGRDLDLLCALSWLVSWTTVGWVTPADLAAAVAWATVRVWEETSQDWPPLKSMPSLRPRVDSEMMPTRMMKAEMPNHHLRLPMKSKEVSPR